MFVNGIPHKADISKLITDKDGIVESTGSIISWQEHMFNDIDII